MNGALSLASEVADLVGSANLVQASYKLAGDSPLFAQHYAEPPDPPTLTEIGSHRSQYSVADLRSVAKISPCCVNNAKATCSIVTAARSTRLARIHVIMDR